MKAVVKKSSVCVLFSTLLIVTYPINYPLFLRLRAVDIVFILFAAWGLANNEVKSRQLLALICAFYIFYFLSTLYGVLFVGIVTPNNFIYAYKYSVLFVLLWLILSSKLNEPQINKLLRLLLFSFLFVVTYELISIYAAMYVGIGQFRPAFPLTAPFPQKTGGYYVSDAHLLAAYLSTGLLAMILCKYYNLLKIRAPFYYALFIIIFIAMLLTGSRNGIMTFAATIVLFNVYLFRKRLSDVRSLTIVRRTTLQLVFVLAITGIVISLCYLEFRKQSHLPGAILNRAFSLDFLQDESALGRVRKLGVAADLVLDGPVLIGVGLQSAPLRFFDGAIASILVSSGLGGIFIFTTIILIFFVGLYKKAVQNQRGSEFSILFFVSLNYILASLVSEFFLVSRSVIPFALFLGLMAKLIQIPRRSLIIEGNQREGFNNNGLLKYSN